MPGGGGFVAGPSQVIPPSSAVGTEYSPRDRLTFFASFLTDRAAGSDSPDVTHSLSTWNIYQLTGGAAFTYSKIDFTIGVSWASGSDDFTPSADTVPPIIRNAELGYTRLKAFLGFEFTS